MTWPQDLGCPASALLSMRPLGSLAGVTSEVMNSPQGAAEGLTFSSAPCRELTGLKDQESYCVYCAHGAVEAVGRSEGLPEVRGAETRVGTGREGPGSAQPVSILSWAPSRKSQSTDSIGLSLWVRPQQTEGPAGLTSSCSRQIRPSVALVTWPSVPPTRAIPGTVQGGGGRKEMGLGETGEAPSYGFRDLDTSPATALTSCVALGGHCFILFTMWKQNNGVNSELEKDNHAMPCSPQFRVKWSQPSSNGQTGGKLPKKIILRKQSLFWGPRMRSLDLGTAFPCAAISPAETKDLAAAPPSGPSAPKDAWPPPARSLTGQLSRLQVQPLLRSHRAACTRAGSGGLGCLWCAQRPRASSTTPSPARAEPFRGFPFSGTLPQPWSPAEFPRNYACTVVGDIKCSLFKLVRGFYLLNGPRRLHSSVPLNDQQAAGSHLKAGWCPLGTGPSSLGPDQKFLLRTELTWALGPHLLLQGHVLRTRCIMGTNKDPACWEMTR